MICGILVNLIYIPYVLRKLGQEEYGVYSLANTVMTYLTLLDSGIAVSITHYTAKYRASGEKDKEAKMLGVFMRIYMVIAAICLLVGAVIIVNVSSIFSASLTAGEINLMRSLLVIVVLNVSVSFPLSIYSAVISGYEHFIFQRGMHLIRTLLIPIISIAVLIFSGRSLAVMAATAVVTLSCNLLNVFYCRKSLGLKIKYAGIDKAMLRKFGVYSAFVFLGTLADKLFWGIDQILLGILPGGSSIEISVYSIAAVFVSAFINMTSVIMLMYVPRFTAMVASGSSEKEISDKFIRLSQIQFFISFYLYLGFILIGRKFVVLWSGAEMEGAYLIAVIVLSGIVLVSAQDVGIAVIYAKSLVKFRSYTYLTAAIVNVVLTALLIPRLGGLGAAIATFVSYVLIIFIVMGVYYHRVVKLNIFQLWKKQIKVILFGGACFFFTHFAMKWLMPQRSTLMSLITTVLLFSFLYVLCLWMYIGKESRHRVVGKIKGFLLRNG